MTSHPQRHAQARIGSSDGEILLKLRKKLKVQKTACGVLWIFFTLHSLKHSVPNYTVVSIYLKSI